MVINLLHFYVFYYFYAEMCIVTEEGICNRTGFEWKMDSLVSPFGITIFNGFGM